MHTTNVQVLLKDVLLNMDTARDTAYQAEGILPKPIHSTLRNA